MRVLRLGSIECRDHLLIIMENERFELQTSRVENFVGV